MFAGGSAVVPGRWVGGLVQGQNHDRLTRFAFCSVFGLTCWGGKDNNATTALTAFLVHIAILFFVGGNAFSFSSFVSLWSAFAGVRITFQLFYLRRPQPIEKKDLDSI